ncbi:hypothetical protein [Streptomyces sp. NPDC056527]|uniref:hypothetical protein n=1 Tax=Streptomyces sp. NPDC056527 TaxID=3345853 RepID=UPI0036B441C9
MSGLAWATGGADDGRGGAEGAWLVPVGAAGMDAVRRGEPEASTGAAAGATGATGGVDAGRGGAVRAARPASVGLAGATGATGAADAARGEAVRAA